MKKVIVLVVLLLGLMLIEASFLSSASTTLKGRVTKVIDGDSVLLSQGGKKYEIRLWGVDCPEYNQPYAPVAKRLSTTLLKGKSVTVEVKDHDSYGRVVGVVYVGSFNVNEELVRQGAAWVYGRYCRESICRQWKKLEASAKADRLGLWGGTKAIAPWKWRKAKS